MCDDSTPRHLLCGRLYLLDFSTPLQALSSKTERDILAGNGVLAGALAAAKATHSPKPANQSPPAKAATADTVAKVLAEIEKAKRDAAAADAERAKKAAAQLEIERAKQRASPARTQATPCIEDSSATVERGPANPGTRAAQHTDAPRTPRTATLDASDSDETEEENNAAKSPVRTPEEKKAFMKAVMESVMKRQQQNHSRQMIDQPSALSRAPDASERGADTSGFLSRA